MDLKVVNRVCVAALIGFIVIGALARLVPARSHLPNRANMYDYTLNTELSGQVCEQKLYPPNFAYPLPGVLFWRMFGDLNFGVGAMAWLLILPASMIGSVFLCDGLLGIEEARVLYWGVSMVVGCIAAEYFLKWDIRVNNVNSFYLFFVLWGAWCWQKEKLIWAGILLAAATALKIYSVAFLPYILFRKEWRLAFAMIIAMAIFFIVLPMFYFGVSETVVLTKQWLAAIHSDSRPEFMMSYPARKVSLTWIAVLLMNPLASHGRYNLLNYSFHSIGTILDVVYLIWALLIIGYFVINLRSEVAPERKKLAFMLDISVLLFCFFPASVFLQPHHLAVLVVPAICLARVMLAGDFAEKFRKIAGVTLVAGLVLNEAIPNPFRGIGIMVTVMLYLASIYIIRRGLCLDLQAPRIPTIQTVPGIAKGTVPV